MKRWTLLILALSFIFMPIAAAVDFIPQGNISLQNVYWIKNNPAGSCSAGMVVSGILANGSWNCTSAASSSGDITDVNAGTGITVTNPTGPAPTVNLNTTYIGNIYVSRSDWSTHDAYPISCNVGYVVQGLGDSLTCVQVDPKIAYITANKMCVGNGTGEAINCTAAIPVDTDTWSTNSTNYYTKTEGNATYILNSSWRNCAGSNNFTSAIGICSAVDFSSYYTKTESNATYDKKTDTLACGRLTGNTSSLCTLTDTDTWALNFTLYYTITQGNATYVKNSSMLNCAGTNNFTNGIGTCGVPTEPQWTGNQSNYVSWTAGNATYLNLSSSFQGDVSGTWNNLVIGGGKVTNAKIATNSVNDSQLMGGAVTNTKIAAGSVNGSQVTGFLACSGSNNFTTGWGSCGQPSGYLTQISDWATQVNSYPTGCSAGYYVQAIGDTLTCAQDLTGAGSGTNYWAVTGSWMYPNSTAGGQSNINVTAINASDWSNVSITNWANQMNNYPAACGSNTVATTIGDTLTCVGIGNTYILANAINTSQIVDGTILSGDISGGAITNSLIAANAVNSSQIVDGTILSGDIAGGAITNTLIAANSVNASQITGFLTCSGSNNFTTGFGTCGQPSGYLTTETQWNSNYTAWKPCTGSNNFTTGWGTCGQPTGYLTEISNWATQVNNYPAACGANTVATTIGDTLTCVGIGNTYILANAINSSQIVDATIASGDIAGGAITNTLIAANAVNSSQIVDATIVSGDISGGAITNTLIAANAVNSSQIIDATIASGDIAGGAITNTLIGAAAVNASQLAANIDASGNNFKANVSVYWAGNQNLAMNNMNVTAVQCVLFQSGGKICSG